MRPYFERDGITIYHGSCLDVLPDLGPVDAIITDPVWPNVPDGLLTGWEDPEGLLRSALGWVGECKRLVIVLRSDSDPRFLRAVPARWPFVCLQALPYAMPMYLGRVLGGTEIAYCFGEPIPSRPGARVIPMWAPKAQPCDDPARVKRNAPGHPCSRHISHQRFLVEWWSDQGETVLDPFMGSGTLLRAALDRGRKAIGIEVEERYCEIAARRLSQGVLQFDEPPVPREEPAQ